MLAQCFNVKPSRTVVVLLHFAKHQQSCGQTDKIQTENLGPTWVLVTETRAYGGTFDFLSLDPRYLRKGVETHGFPFHDFWRGEFSRAGRNLDQFIGIQFGGEAKVDDFDVG